MDFRLTEYGNSRNVTARLELTDDHLSIDFDVSGLGKLAWPETSAGTPRQDGLWQTTCMELFIGVAGEPGYLEVNLSPSAAWNCYRFDDYRKGMVESRDMMLQEVLVNKPMHQLKAVFSCPPLAEKLTVAPCLVADLSGELHFFAPTHGERPDFHDRSLHVLVSRDDL